MKMQYSLLAILLVVLLFMSTMCSCVGFKPYSPDTIFSKEYKLEHFQTQKKEGFSNLDQEQAPYEKSSTVDIFSGTKGSLDCDKLSSGLTNSKGGLCLTTNQTDLLKTRGGNATGGMQIGA